MIQSPLHPEYRRTDGPTMQKYAYYDLMASMNRGTQYNVDTY